MAEHMEAGALGAAEAMDSPLVVNNRRAADATIDDVLRADGYLFCAPENLASTSGAMLEFFHSTYYHAFDDEEASLLLGRPFGLAIAAGSDGTNAAKQIERICTGWRLKQVSDTFVNASSSVEQTKANILAEKACEPLAAERCAEIGGLVAATICL